MSASCALYCMPFLAYPKVMLPTNLLGQQYPVLQDSSYQYLEKCKDSVPFLSHIWLLPSSHLSPCLILSMITSRHSLFCTFNHQPFTLTSGKSQVVIQSQIANIACIDSLQASRYIVIIVSLRNYDVLQKTMDFIIASI